MDLHEIIAAASDIISDAVVGEQGGDLDEAYNQMKKIYNLLVEEFVPMEHP